MAEIRRSGLRPPTRLVLIRINYNRRRDITGYIVEGKGRSTTEDRIISQAHGGRLIRRKGGGRGAGGRRRPLFSPGAREKQVSANRSKRVRVQGWPASNGKSVLWSWRQRIQGDRKNTVKTTAQAARNIIRLKTGGRVGKSLKIRARGQPKIRMRFGKGEKQRDREKRERDGEEKREQEEARGWIKAERKAGFLWRGMSAQPAVLVLVVYADTPGWYVSAPGLAPTDRSDIIQLASSLIPFIRSKWRQRRSDSEKGRKREGRRFQPDRHNTPRSTSRNVPWHPSNLRQRTTRYSTPVISSGFFFFVAILFLFFSFFFFFFVFISQWNSASYRG